MQINADQQRLLEALKQQQSELIDVLESIIKTCLDGDLKKFMRDFDRLKLVDRNYRLRHTNRLNALSKKKWLSFEQSSHLRLAIAQNESTQQSLQEIETQLDSKEPDPSMGGFLYNEFIGPMEFELEKLVPLYTEAMQFENKTK